MAGITAARELKQRGFSTIVLEASDRLGGRTYTIEDERCSVELSGPCIYCNQPFIWAEKERYGLAIEETPGCVAEHIAIHRGDRIEALAADEIGEVMAGFDVFFSEAIKVWERPYDSKHSWDAICERDAITVADRMASLALTPLQKAGIGGSLEILSMSAPASASYVEMMRCNAFCGWNTTVFKDSTARNKFANETAALVGAIVRDGSFEVSTNNPVTTVNQHNDGITVAMNVMNCVAFNPPLSSIKQEATDVKHAGWGIQSVLRDEGRSRPSDDPGPQC